MNFIADAQQGNGEHPRGGLSIDNAAAQMSDAEPLSIEPFAKTPLNGNFVVLGFFAGGTPAPQRAEFYCGAGVPPARCRFGSSDPMIQKPSFASGSIHNS